MGSKNKNMKKVIAVALCAAMTVGYLPVTEKPVMADETESSVAFDADNVVLKLGVMSDIHLSYAYHSQEAIKKNVENYAKAVGTLNEMSGNDLDVLMLAGDYTSYGCYEQAKTFASASQAIMDEINKGKEEGDKTQFFFTYGNHDTEWNGQMSYANWEKLLGTEYSLLDGVTMGPENTGCYKYTRTVGDKTYYFFSVETERYNAPSNMFCKEVLEWLDKELAQTPTDAYVYVVSHGPIKETGVYGADIEYEKNADWGTAEDGYTQNGFQRNTQEDTSTWDLSSEINQVLKKYPQVMYFSGHTHMTNELESTIMSGDYTAITVSQFYTADLYSSLTKYLDAGQNMTRPGYSLYVEVDKDGNQRITRVNTQDAGLIDSVVVEGEATSVENPVAADAAAYPNINAYYTTSVSMTAKEGGTAKTLTPWTMKAPQADKSHLTTYSAATRKETPTFHEGALTIDKMLNNAGESMTFTYTFPTATCENSHVIRYDLTLYTAEGNALDTQWILGDWTDNTDGVTESGKTHFDANTLTYNVTYDGTKLANVTDVYAKVTAVNEFGGKTTLTSNTEDASAAVGIMKPSALDANKNMFDGLSTEDIQCNLLLTSDGNYNPDAVKTTFDHENRATTVVNTSTNAELLYNLSKSSDVGTAWGRVTRYGRLATKLDVEDTFVYQTNFSVEKNGGLYFTFRATESADSHWKADYSGIFMDQGSTRLYLNQEKIAESTAFKLTDTDTHKLLIVSAPTTVSVWIDDIMIFSNQTYDVKEAVKFSGDGSTDSPYKHNEITLQNTDMVPVIAVYINSASTFTLSNQYLYVYDQKAQTEEDYKATERNYFDSEQVTTGGNAVITSKTAMGLKIDATGTSNDLYGNCITQALSDDFSATDSVITEFDYTPTNMAELGDSGWNNIVGLTINFRSNGEEDGTARLLIRANGSQNLFHFKDGTHAGMSYSGSAVREGETVHVKILHDNEKATVWMDGKKVFDNTYKSVNSTLNTATMKPIFTIGTTHANYSIDNIVIRKADGSGVLEGVTAVTDQNNLLNGDYGQITSTFKGNKSWEGKSNSVVSGNNFYTDLTWQTLQANGADANGDGWYYMGENFYPFGSGNVDSPLKGSDSFVMSALVRVANEGNVLENGTNLNHRVGMSVANYNGTKLWFFVEKTNLQVLTTKGSDTKFIATVNLNTQIGYTIGDYVRMTTAVSPYGFDLYMNGTKVYSYAGGDGTNVSYEDLSWTTNGTAVRFLDASVSYNDANLALIKNGLQDEIDTYQNLKGVYFANAAELNAKVTEITQACAAATKSSELSKYVGALTSAYKQSQKIVNNLVYDGTTAVSSEESGLYTDTATYQTKLIQLFKDGTCPITAADTWVMEADVKNAKANDQARRFGIKLGADEYILMFQYECVFVDSSASWQQLTNQNKSSIQNDVEWHVRYTITKDDTIRVTVTSKDGATTYLDDTYELSKLIKGNLDESYTFAPSFFYSNQSVELSNIYVGYDLSASVTALNNAITVAKAKDLSAYTWESGEAFEAKIADTQKIADEIKTYVGENTGVVYTTPYNKTEIAAYIAGLGDFAFAQKQNTVTIGTDGTGSGALAIGVAEGSALPTGAYVGDKYYVTGWTCEGEAVTTVSDVNKTYVPEYIDLDMLNVKAQKKQSATAGKYDIRFIASVNNLNYQKAGMVFSVKDKNPTIGASMCVTKEVNTVYEMLFANSDKLTTAEIYKNNYSTYLFAHAWTDVPENATIYARAYVKMMDGTIVYGPARAVSPAEMTD